HVPAITINPKRYFLSGKIRGTAKPFNSCLLRNREQVRRRCNELPTTATVQPIAQTLLALLIVSNYLNRNGINVLFLIVRDFPALFGILGKLYNLILVIRQVGVCDNFLRF